MAIVIQDLKYGFRMLRKSPGFTAVAVLTLALGIGANTAIFSAVNAVLLRPLPYRNSSQLVRVWATELSRHDVASYPSFIDWSAQSHSFQQMAAYRGGAYNLSGGDRPERIRGLQVSTGLLRMLDVKPALGRDFLPEELQPGRSHVALLTDDLWRSHFAADPHVLGRTIKLNGQSYEVVGVLPSELAFPPDQALDLMLPLEPDLNRGHGFLYVVGRLRPGVTITEAQVEMTAITGRLGRQYNQDKGVGVELQPLQASFVDQFRPVLLVLLGSVGFVLLIACANAGNLFLGRGASRQRELAVRASLGAARSRLIRQLLTESLLVGILGGALGLLLAFWGVQGLVALLSRNFSIPSAGHIRVDRWVLAFTLGVSLLTGLVSGLFPALASSKVDLNESLKEGSRGLGGTTGRNRFRALLVVSEVALTLVLLSGAGLTIKSFMLLTEVTPGLRTEDVLVVDFSLQGSWYTHTATRSAAFHQMLARVKALPGVRSAAVVADVPLTDNTDKLGFSVDGLPDPPGRLRQARFNVVGPSYFRTLGIPLIAGRDLTDADTESSPGVVMINQAMARRFWPHRNPIGQRITTDQRAWFSVVGVVGDVRQNGLGAPPQPEVYLSYLQDTLQWPYVSMLVQTTSDPWKFLPAVEQAVWSVDKDQPVSNPRTMDQIRADSIAQPQVTALLLGLFAALALMLASVGLYGVVAQFVTKRTHDIGVRMALGAGRSEVLRMVLRNALLLVLAGMATGIAGALVLTRFLSSFLFGVRPSDPGTFAAVSALLIVVAVLASYFPARRATRVDPIVALRYE